METLIEFIPERWIVAIPPRDAWPAIWPLAARLACRAPLHLAVSCTFLDGGNCFNAYRVAQALRKQTSAVEAALQRIHVARAFTCYQMAALLEETSVELSSNPAPVLVLDPLATYADENIPATERRRLLEQCICEIQRLSRTSLVVVFLVQRPDPLQFQEILTQAAGAVWQPELSTTTLLPSRPNSLLEMGQDKGVAAPELRLRLF